MGKRKKSEKAFVNYRRDYCRNVRGKVRVTDDTILDTLSSELRKSRFKEEDRILSELASLNR